MKVLQSKYFALPLDELKKEESSSSDLFLSKYLNKHYQRIKALPDDLLRLPSPEEIFFLDTENAFNAFTFIVMVAKTQSIKELLASTYSINIRVIESLMELHDNGFIDSITLMVSDSLIKRNPTTIDLLSALVKSRPNIKVVYTWNHSKVSLMRTENNHYVVEGSGNWSENALIEQYVFVNSQDVFEGRKKMFDRISKK